MRQKETYFTLESEFHGVWKYRKLIHSWISPDQIVTRGEGCTHLYANSNMSKFVGIRNYYLKHEGENPTGSFKDRGMTVAVSEAIRLGVKETICASTGNTSASAAAYSAMAGLVSNVMIPKGNISVSKLLQAVAYGARIIEIPGDFDMAMSGVARVAEKDSRYYLLNSINPWRIEGQKTITFEIMEQVKNCDFISLPAGNLGNTSAVGKALRELKILGVIDHVPRIISVQAEGASPFYDLWSGNEKTLRPVKAETVASAIRIGNPVNWEKAIRAIRETGGIVTRVSDDEILKAKSAVDRSGIGCEPASAAAVAGVRKLRDEGTIDAGDVVVSILTGHILKDTASIQDPGNRIPHDQFMANMPEESIQ